MATRMKKVVIGALIGVIGLPVALLLTVTLSIAVLNRTNGRLVSSGKNRTYLLHVPKGHDPARPVPLVISLHGAAGWPAQQQNLSGWNRLADAEGFLVAYPSGIGTPRIWHVEPGDDLERDVRFISDLVDALQAKFAIDPARIYVNGISNGGGMAFALSCRMSHRFAAVGLVAAAQTLPANWCTDPRPVPIIAFHGAADPIVPYAGGLLGDPFNPVKVTFPAVRDWTADWARRNRCDANPVESSVTANVHRLAYLDPAGGADVVLYTVRNGGHTWPGGKPLPQWWAGPTSREVDATELMWTFFREHPLRPR